MGYIGKDFKYKVVKNFLQKNEIDLLKHHCEIKHRLNLTNFDFDQSHNADTMFYADPIMESLMLCKKNLVQKECGKNLLETYTFWRTYTKYATLEKHTDRPSCEISVTVNIDGDGTPWPIYMEGNSLDLQPGDAALYLGCEIEHWRDEFRGDYQHQVFLHYVDANGPNKEYHKDKRPMLGVST